MSVGRVRRVEEEAPPEERVCKGGSAGVWECKREGEWCECRGECERGPSVRVSVSGECVGWRVHGRASGKASVQCKNVSGSGGSQFKWEWGWV